MCVYTKNILCVYHMWMYVSVVTDAEWRESKWLSTQARQAERANRRFPALLDRKPVALRGLHTRCRYMCMHT
jgi:hypothetical protein